jgi:MoaA/NifB/PqqE/SkfB family radical SAM enzyme
MTTVLWDVTNRCNLRCAHCAAAELYYNQSPGAEVTFEEALAILRHLREIDCQQLRLVGGEPLLRRDIVDLVTAAHRMGFPRVLLFTNGTRLTPELAGALLDAGLDEFIVSLEGATTQSHEQVRGKGTYVQAMQGLELMLRRRPAGHRLKVGVLLTLSRPNLHEAALIVELAGRMGLDCLVINELQMRGNARQNAERLFLTVVESMDAREAVLEAASNYPHLQLQVFGRPRAIEYFNARFGRDLPVSTPSCGLLNGQVICVEADGAVSACENTQGEGATPAQVEARRLQTRSFPDILASSHFDSLRQLVSCSLAESWQDDFIPCARCHYRPACQLCPLFLRQQKDRIVHECLLAIRRLARWRRLGARREVVLSPLGVSEEDRAFV